MISKIGEELVKQGFIIGGIRAANLNKEEEDALKREYGLSPSSNLVLRNMGRDIAGSIAGGMPGKFLANYGLALEHPNVVKAAVPLAWGGSILGSILASNKYSKGHAQEIMRERKKAGE